MLTGDQTGREYSLVNRITTLGRSANNDIVIADPKTSRRHMQIVFENGAYHAIDTGSANGFLVNDQPVQRAQLQNGSVIAIGLVRIAFQLGERDNANQNYNKATSGNPVPGAEAVPTGLNIPPADESALPQIDLRGRPMTAIGREADSNQIVLDHPQISRHHLQVSQQNGSYIVTDLRSTNGTFVNGQRIFAPTPLNDGDIINLGPFRFMFTAGLLYRDQQEDSVRVDVLNLSRKVASGQILLSNVSFTVLPREFVAIVGGSGTGKSTLLDAISGVRPATGGAVLYNKAEYYPQMEVYRSSIGYVPQDDIVPTELTVNKALYYAARLRLPQDTTPTELQERLDDVIDDLDLETRRDTTINLLSGGQRKRVSIGAELISKPSLFFLDEPTSGLDPGLEGRMMSLLRKLADQGRTVILITHATQNVELCDQVLFLARGGYMAFYGSPQSALEYFGVTRFSEIYIKLEQELSPEEWAKRFVASPYYARNVGARMHAVAREAARYGVPTDNAARVPMPSADQPAPPPVVFRRSQTTLSGLRQFGLFTRRYLEILTKDTKNLLILLLQAPIIALMMILVFKATDFNRPGDYNGAKTLIFLMVVVATWFGTSNAAREIVKEASIYRRERRIGLKLAPYIFSKLVVQSLLVLVQVAMLVGIVWLGLGLGSPSVESIFYLYLTLFLTALGGVTMGLFISAATSNSDRATSFVPVALIPQIIFGGAVVSFERMGKVGEWFSNLMISKWGYQASGRILDLDSISSTPLHFNGPPPDQADRIEALFPGSVFLDRRTLEWNFIPKRSAEFTTDVYLQWGILGLIILVCLGLIIYFQLRKDHNFSR
jgi:ABC transport system ATP-binding/permease protein